MVLKGARPLAVAKGSCHCQQQQRRSSFQVGAEMHAPGIGRCDSLGIARDPPLGTHLSVAIWLSPTPAGALELPYPASAPTPSFWVQTPTPRAQHHSSRQYACPESVKPPPRPQHSAALAPLLTAEAEGVQRWQAAPVRVRSHVHAAKGQHGESTERAPRQAAAAFCPCCHPV